MKKSWGFLTVAVTFLLPAIFFCARYNENSAPKYYERSEKIMGTTVTLKASGISAKTAVDKSFAALFKFVENVNDDVNSLNESAGSDTFVKISPEVFEMLKLARLYSELTDGAFDVTVGAAVDLWRTARKNKIPPSPAEIETVKLLVGFEHLHLNEKETGARLDLVGAKINLGGVGKGYGVDIIRKIFEDEGIRDGIIDFGTSSIFAFGKKRIGLKNPRGKHEISEVVEIENAALSTSGDYEQFFVANGRRFHHIIDPKTCLPTDNGVASVTIALKKDVENCGAISDILSTSLLILGKDSSQKILETLPPKSVVIFWEEK